MLHELSVLQLAVYLQFPVAIKMDFVDIVLDVGILFGV